jgi:hypothetical protein
MAEEEKKVPLATKVAISVTALAVAAIHVSKTVVLDKFSAGFLVLAFLPWLAAFVKSIEITGFAKMETKDFKDLKTKVDVLTEVLPVAISPVAEKPKFGFGAAARSQPQAPHPDDPQKGLWGGRRESNYKKVTAGKIRPLRSDSENYRIPLEVGSTDPAGHPLTGKVRFHLHDTFRPSVEEVVAEHGVARLTLVAYGAFTVGVDLEDGTKLEIDLADPDIDAPKAFKEE